MQVRIFFHFLLITFFILISTQVIDAQRIEKNNGGEKIIRYPDGKWVYFDKRNPTHVEIEKANESSKIVSSNDIFEEKTSKGIDNDEQRYEKKLSEAEDQLALAKEKENDIKFSKILLEEEMEDLKRGENATDEQLNAVKRQLKLITVLEKNAKKKTKKSKKELAKIKKRREIAQKPPRKKSKKKKSKKKKELRAQERELQDSRFTYKEDENFYLAAKNFKKYSIANDVMYNPPQEGCNLAYDGVDEFIGKKRKDVERDVFFTFTNDDMRRYMKQEDYITCEGNLTQIKGGILLLNLFITVNTTDAQRSFGGLSKGSLLIIKMINGEIINLVNNQSDDGVFDPIKKQHTFTGQFRINGGQERVLKKGEVDLVRVIWEAGYEDYEVYNLDFFINQFKCLEK